MNRRQTDISDVGESTLVVGEQTVAKTTGFHPSTDDNLAAVLCSLERTPSNKLNFPYPDIM